MIIAATIITTTATIIIMAQRIAPTATSCLWIRQS
jgi:hypothetical protein